MGVFRDFFIGLWSDYIRTPLDNVKEYLDTKVGAPIKDALSTIFDSLESIKTELLEIPARIIDLKDKFDDLVAPLTEINDWLIERKEDIIKLLLTFLEYVQNRQISFWIGWMQRVRCVEALKNVYLVIPGYVKENPGVAQYYKTRKSELESEGMKTVGDLALGVVGTGVKKGVDAITKAALDNLMPVFDDLLEEQHVPEKDRETVRNIANSGEFGLNAVVAFMLGHFLSPVLSTSLAPAWEGMGQVAWKALPVHLADVGTLMRLKYRGLITPAFYEEQLRKQGVGTEVQKAYEDGYLFYPAPTDLVTWLAKEVFEPEMIERYGLDDELPTGQLDLFAKAGVNLDQMTNYWRAHWEHPGWSAVREMLFRADLTEDEVYEWFRLVEIPPYWREKYTKIMYTPITRVDLRRMWDLRVITVERLKKGYTDIGYNEENAELMTLWTRIYVLEHDLRDRYKKGWITIDELKSELSAAGMPGERLEEWVETIIKAEKPERLQKERDLTKAEIIKGVKKGVIDLGQGQELLEDMGYDSDEAEYLLLINIEAAKGSPESFWEFKKITELEKKAEGREGKRVPETLIEAEKKYRKHPERTDLELEYREEMQKWEEETP